MRRPRWGLGKSWFDSLAPKSPFAWARIASGGLTSTGRHASGFLWLSTLLARSTGAKLERREINALALGFPTAFSDLDGAHEQRVVVGVAVLFGDALDIGEGYGLVELSDFAARSVPFVHAPLVPDREHAILGALALQ